jgi:hypothetical protein
MIGVLVTLQYGDEFDAQAVQRIAFTFNAAKREAVNFYIWDSADAAVAFFTDQLLDRLTGLYGVRPILEFVHVAALVENT